MTESLPDQEVINNDGDDDDIDVFLSNDQQVRHDAIQSLRAASSNKAKYSRRTKSSVV